VVELDSGDELAARTVVLATGASYRRLPVAGIERLNGSGVFYAATLVESRMCGTQTFVVAYATGASIESHDRLSRI